MNVCDLSGDLVILNDKDALSEKANWIRSLSDLLHHYSSILEYLSLRWPISIAF